MGIGRGAVKAATGLLATAAAASGTMVTGRVNGPRRYRNPALRTPAATPESRRLTTSDGAILNVAVYGPADGRPIVLIHGWCEQIAHWNPQINALASEYRVIAFDHRGHGASTRGSRPEHPDVLADDLADVLSATLRPGERAVLVGHSMGAMTIMSWAHRHRAQAGYAGAILLNNTGYAKLVEETKLLPFIPAGLLPRGVGVFILSGALPFPPPLLMRPLVKWRIMPGGGREEVDFCTRMFVECDPRARASWGRALSGLDLDGPNPIPGVPTTIIAGERDYLTPPVHARRIAAVLERAGTLHKLLVLPGVGHQGNIEAVDTFTAEVRALAVLVAPAGSLDLNEAAG